MEPLNMRSMKFELTNKERIYFGLDLVTDDLKRHEINDNYVYYTDKNNCITKVSYLFEYSDYYDSHEEEIKYRFDEYDTCFQLVDNKILISKAKNKVKDITTESLSALKPTGIRFQWCGSIRISLDKNFTNYYDSRVENVFFYTIDDLRNWIFKYIQESDEFEIEKIEKYKKQKGKRIIAKDGDFFAFKINRWEYGFGRVIDNLFEKYRSDKDFFKDHKNFGLRFFGSPVMVKLYLYKSKELTIDLNELKNTISFPSCVIRDYPLLKGEYKIIGNLKLTDFEYDFPITCGLYGPHPHYKSDTISYINWGYLTLFKEDTSWFYNSFFQRVDNMSDVTYYQMLNYIGLELFNQCYNSQSLDLFWKKKYVEIDEIMETDTDHYRKPFIDLRSPLYKEYKEKLFALFGVDPSKNYVENYELLKKNMLSSLAQSSADRPMYEMWVLPGTSQELISPQETSTDPTSQESNHSKKGKLIGRSFNVRSLLELVRNLNKEK